MERSCYLDLFQPEKMTEPYGSRSEANHEEVLALAVLMQLAQKRESRGISLVMASHEWALTRLHLKRRREASGEKGTESGISQAARRFSLNAAEYLALLLAYGVRKGEIRPEELSRIRGERKKETPSIRAAEVLYAFLFRLENSGEEEENRHPGRRAERLRRDRLELCFCGGWQEEGAGQEAPLELRQFVWEWIEGDEELDAFFSGKDGVFRRRTAQNPLPPILAYTGLFRQIIGMCELPADHMSACDGQTEGAPTMYRKEEDWNLCLVGEEGSGKEFLAWHLAAKLNRGLLAVDQDRLADAENKGTPGLGAEKIRERLIEAVGVCLLSGDLLYWKNREERYFSMVRNYLSGLILLGEEPGEEEEKRGRGMEEQKTVCLELPILSVSQKERFWSAWLNEYPHSARLVPSLLASKYVLNAGGIKRVLYGAWKKAAGAARHEIEEEDLSWAVRQARRGQLGSYASQVPCIFSWEDLIVEEKVKRQMKYLCGQVKYRGIVGDQWGFFEKMPYGKGLCALFYGPPGTGKTMAAQVIARELGMDLYRVDLSRMVSKYIGETEKHISALFEKAKQMNGILFFDEADSFFSKRSEIKDANDRNANSEVSHLLQKLEEYEGVTILATNLKENMDEAFKRRISFMIHFRLPSKETRRALWHSLLPEKAPREDTLDLDFFAERFELSGSQIKEILLQAAYIAAGEGSAIGNRQIKEAVCLNHEKYGKTVTEADFGYLAVR